MQEILKGIVDIHIHAGPSVANREVDAAEMLQEAIQYGFRAFVVKDHYFPTTFSATLVEKHLGNAQVNVYGAIALNNSVGGINVKAADAAYGMGAKIVYMPTISAAQHMEVFKGHFPGTGSGPTVAEKPIYYLDEKGELKEEVIDLLKYMATKPDYILASGHGTPEEIDALVHKAVELGVQKIMLDHPFFITNATMEQIEKWGKMGCYIEGIAASFFDNSAHKGIDLNLMAQVFEKVPMEQIVIASDFGQKGNGSPAQGFLKFIKRLMEELHVTEQQINMMCKQTPGMLLGI